MIPFVKSILFLLFYRSDVSSTLVDSEDEATGDVTPGTWRAQSFAPVWEDFNPQCRHNYGMRAKQIRDEFKEYFNNEGVVPWQWRQCGIV